MTIMLNWKITCGVLFFNFLAGILLVIFDFGFLQSAEEKKRCTHREWKQKRKGFINCLLWTSIRDCIPWYYYAMHIMTRVLLVCGAIFPFFFLFGNFLPSVFVEVLIIFWVIFTTFFIFMEGLWEKIRSPKHSLLWSILALIVFILVVCAIGAYAYKLLGGMTADMFQRLFT